MPAGSDRWVVRKSTKSFFIRSDSRRHDGDIKMDGGDKMDRFTACDGVSVFWRFGLELERHQFCDFWDLGETSSSLTP